MDNNKKAISKEEIKLLEQQRDEIDAQISSWYKEKGFKAVQSHKKFVGKCFKKKKSDKYYKVLSQFANNEYRMTCLTFDLDAKILTYRMLGNMRKTDFPFINPEIDLFELEDIFSFSPNSLFFETVDEISSVEFDDAMKKKYLMFLKEIKKFPKDVENEIVEYKEKYVD